VSTDDHKISKMKKTHLAQVKITHFITKTIVNNNR